MSISSIWLIDRTLSGATTPSQRTRKQWKWKDPLHFPKFQHYWSLTIRLLRVISRILVGGVLPSTEIQSVYSTAPADWATGHSLGESYHSAAKESVFLLPQPTGPQGSHYESLTPLERCSQCPTLFVYIYIFCLDSWKFLHPVIWYEIYIVKLATIVEGNHSRG